MAYQQQQVPCPPNAWTQISEYRPTRKSLIVQCPQVPNLRTSSQSLFSDPQAIVPFDGLRRLLMIFNVDVRPLSVWSGSSGNAAQPPIKLQPVLDASGGQSSVLIDGSWGDWCQETWSAGTAAGGAGPLLVGSFEEHYGCKFIVLATAQNAGIPNPPFVSVPAGVVIGPDFSAGPTDWRLSDETDGEQTIQAWYAWPYGYSNVNITVSESWTDNQPPAPPKMFRVDLPRLSADAIAALNELLGKMSQYDEPGAANAA